MVALQWDPTLILSKDRGSWRIVIRRKSLITYRLDLHINRKKIIYSDHELGAMIKYNMEIKVGLSWFVFNTIKGLWLFNFNAKYPI